MDKPQEDCALPWIVGPFGQIWVAADGVDFTLCGLAMEGALCDVASDPGEAVESWRRIDCPACVRIIRFCKQISVSDVKDTP